MKKSLLLCLALFATSSFAYVGSVPISQTQNVATKQNEKPNLMSSMSTKVRIYNDSSQVIFVSAYSLFHWDTASSWKPSHGYSTDMTNGQNHKIAPHSWMDIYSTDSSNFFGSFVKYNVYGGYIPNAVSFTFANKSSGTADGPGQPMDVYHGYDDNYTKKIHFNSISHSSEPGSMYDINACNALIINDNSAIVVPSLNRNTCDVTEANKNGLFSLY